MITKYMHKETGSIDDMDGWISAYSAEELEYRGFKTAEEAFDFDVSEGLLIEIEPVREAARLLGQKGGSVKSERKAAAVRENGKKGGRPAKKYYYFFSGEGEEGRWESRYCTLLEARRFAEAIRSGGDRWCSIWGLYRSDGDPLILYNIDTDELRHVPLNAIMDL